MSKTIETKEAPKLHMISADELAAILKTEAAKSDKFNKARQELRDFYLTTGKKLHFITEETKVHNEGGEKFTLYHVTQSSETLCRIFPNWPTKAGKVEGQTEPVGFAETRLSGHEGAGFVYRCYQLLNYYNNQTRELIRGEAERLNPEEAAKAKQAKAAERKAKQTTATKEAGEAAKAAGVIVKREAAIQYMWEHPVHVRQWLNLVAKEIVNKDMRDTFTDAVDEIFDTMAHHVPRYVKGGLKDTNGDKAGKQEEKSVNAA